MATVLSIGFSLLIAELALRLIGFSHPNFYGPDPDRGWSLKPGTSGWWTSEGRAFVRVDAHGLRTAPEAPDRAVAKPADTLRIAVLGDSCVEAVQVPYEKTFAALMEQELARCPAAAGRRMEVLNFGVSGYGTAQELLTLRHDVWPYAPDLVLLAFYSGNDVRNNSKPLDADPARPFLFHPSGGGRTDWQLDLSFRDSTSYRWRSGLPMRAANVFFNHVRLMQLGKEAETLVKRALGSERAKANETGAALQELGLDNAVYAPPTEPTWIEAWRTTEDLFVTFRDEVAAHGSRFALTSLTTPIQVNPDPAARADFAAKLGVNDLLYPDRRLQDFGAAEHVETLVLAPGLQAMAEREHAILHGFDNTKLGEGHWNERGHAAAAARLGPWVCSQLSKQGKVGVDPK